MKKFFLLSLVVAGVIACNNIKKESGKSNLLDVDSKRWFHDTSDKVLKIEDNCSKYYESEDLTNINKCSDSIKNIIIGSYLKDHVFTAIDSLRYDTSKRKKPLFLNVTASWCAPCVFEITALNKVVEKYHNKVDFVLLFWDIHADLKKIAPKYHEKIVLVPSPKRKYPPNLLEINGFKHVLGFPTNYAVNMNNQIINFLNGAKMPSTYIDSKGVEITVTKEEADNWNYNQLEKEVLELLGNL